MMDIFAFANKMERDGCDFYQQLARKTPHKCFVSIFKLLAEEEYKHAQAIESLQSGLLTLSQSNILYYAHTLFQRVPDFGVGVCIADEIALYQQAMKYERKSEDFYLECIEQTLDSNSQKLFSHLASEEKKHYYLLENIVEFVSRREQLYHAAGV